MTISRSDNSSLLQSASIVCEQNSDQDQIEDIECDGGGGGGSDTDCEPSVSIGDVNHYGNNDSGGGGGETITALCVSARHEAFLTEPRAWLSSDANRLLCHCNDTVTCVPTGIGAAAGEGAGVAAGADCSSYTRLQVVDDAVHVFAAWDGDYADNNSSSSNSDVGGGFGSSNSVSISVITSHQSGLLRLWTVGGVADTAAHKHSATRDADATAAATAATDNDRQRDVSTLAAGSNQSNNQQQLEEQQRQSNPEPVYTWRSLHTGPVTALVFDRTGTLAASGGAGDASVRVWDTQHHHCTHSLRCCPAATSGGGGGGGGQGTVRTLAFYQPSAESVHLLASADMSVEAEIYGWCLRSGEQRLRLRGHFGTVTCLHVVHSVGVLVSGARDKVLMVWDVRERRAAGGGGGGGELLRTIAVGEPVETLAVIASSISSKCVDTRHSDSVAERLTALQVATGGGGGSGVRLWNVATSRCTGRCGAAVAGGATSAGAAAVISQLLYAGRAAVLAAVSAECTVTLYRLPDGSIERQLVGCRDQVLDMAFCSPNSTNSPHQQQQQQVEEQPEHLVVATNSGVLKLYRLDTMDCRLLDGHTDTVMAVDVCQSDRSLVASASRDGTVRVWRLLLPSSPSLPLSSSGSALSSSGRAAAFVCVAVGTGHTAPVTCVAWSRSSSSSGPGRQQRHLWTGSDDRCLKLWRVPIKCVQLTGATTATTQQQQQQPEALLCVWSDVAHDKALNAVSVAPNDRLVATASRDKTARLYRCIGSGSGGGGAAGGDGDVTAAAQLVAVMRGHRRAVWHVAFSPVDQLLATASADTTVRLWSVTQPAGTCLRVLEAGGGASGTAPLARSRAGDGGDGKDGGDNGGGGGGSVLRCVFVGGGRQLLGSTSEGLLHLWHAASGECTRSYGGEHTARVWALAVSGAGAGGEQQLISGGADSNLIVWRLVTQREQQQRDTASQQLATQQRQALSNLVQQRRWLPALRLAIRLDRPAACLDILRHLLMTPTTASTSSTTQVQSAAATADDDADDHTDTTSEAERQLELLLEALRDDQLAALLRFAVDWNTNTRHCHYTQLLVWLLLRQRTPAQWRRLPDYRRTLEALLPYTQRHVERLKRLQCSAALIDYTALCMNLTATTAAAAAAADDDDGVGVGTTGHSSHAAATAAAEEERITSISCAGESASAAAEESSETNGEGEEQSNRVSDDGDVQQSWDEMSSEMRGEMRHSEIETSDGDTVAGVVTADIDRDVAIGCSSPKPRKQQQQQQQQRCSKQKRKRTKKNTSAVTSCLDSSRQSLKRMSNGASANRNTVGDGGKKKRKQASVPA